MSNDDCVVTMPKLGESVTEGEITNWFKQPGQEVAFDDPLFEVSTDKVDSEIPSPCDGQIAEILVPAGQTVPVGTPLVRITPVGAMVENRIPAAAHRVAAAGGRGLDEPSAPQMGGSEAMPAIEDPGVSAPSGAVHDITMPKLGESVTEGEITNWFKRPGEQVAFDDPLFEVSTDKVDSEIPSPYDGVLLEILVPAGQTVPVGTPLARIGEPAGPGGAPSPAATTTGTGTSAGAPTGAKMSGAGTAEAPARAPSGAAPGAPTAVERDGRMLSPLVRRLVAEAGLDVSTITGTGAGGRIRREDVEQAIAAKQAGTATAPPTAPERPAPSRPVEPPPRAPAPAAPGPAPTAAPPPSPAPAATASGDARDEVVTLSRMRLAVGEGMKRSQTTTASVWTSVEVDFDNVEKTRQRHKDRFRKETGASLSYLPFVCRVVVDALRAFPTVNSSIDIEAKTMTLHPYVNLGIAVDLDQQGLVVPVVRDADTLNIRGIAKKITELASAARARKLPSSQMRGSTFTITNPGPFASYASAPIINQPNVAILCTDGVKRRPVAVGDTIAIHPTGVVGLVYDHRAFDGSTASLFLLHIRDALEQRDWEAEVG